MNDETRINRVNRFINTLNQARELGLNATEAGEGYLVMELPYSDRIIGNPGHVYLLEYGADDFATHACSSCGAVCHNAPGR